MALIFQHLPWVFSLSGAAKKLTIPAMFLRPKDFLKSMFLVSLLPLSSAFADLTVLPVGNGILGRQSNYNPCGKYQNSKNFDKNGKPKLVPGKYVDNVVLTKRRAFIEVDSETGAETFVFKALLAAGICRSSGVFADGKVVIREQELAPGVTSQMAVEPNGKSPTASDFGLAIVAAQKVSEISKVRWPFLAADRQGNVWPYEKALQTYTFRMSKDGDFSKEVEFRFPLADLLRNRTFESLWDDYLKKEEIHLALVINYCSTNLTSTMAGDEFRPPFAREDIHKVFRIQDSSSRARNTECYKLEQNPVHVVLNNKGGNNGSAIVPGDNPNNPSRPLPEPSGKFKELMEKFADDTQTKAVSREEILGWYSSRCYYRIDLIGPSGNLPGNELFVGRKTTYTYPDPPAPDRTGMDYGALFWRNYSGFQDSSATRPDYYDDIPSRTEREIRKVLSEKYPENGSNAGLTLNDYEQYVESTPAMSDANSNLVVRFRRALDGSLIFIKYKYPASMDGIYSHARDPSKDQGVPFVACHSVKKIRDK